jgi:glycosyltransferase involved in cell wall biosynthesis
LGNLCSQTFGNLQANPPILKFFKALRILFDSQIFSLQKYGGISRYYSEILKFLLKEKNIEVEFPLYITDNFHLLNYGLGETQFIRVFKNYIPGRIKNYLRKKSFVTTERLLKSGQFDVFVPTYYDSNFLKFIGNTPYVLTVYDMIHENYPQLEKDSSIILDKKLLIESADRIIAISQSTKNDILNIYPHISADKIQIVYLSHSLEKVEIRNQLIQKVVDKSNFILFVGNRGFYKNFKLILPLISGWLKKNNLKLLCLGGGGFSEEETILISEFGLSDYVVQYTFKDHELYGFYNKAMAFIFPSEYEGFGIPVLESMFSGCPVLLPKLTSFPEVAGEAGEYFDLDDPNSLLDSLDKVCFDEAYRDQLIQKGIKQAEKFSWEKTFIECLEIYKSVGSQKRLSV